ncbi:MAG: 2-amino-4-hydroxy-6-hydroxymethyldihydropteridine diphosphokinase [Deltaproteobacteria bacterium]|nr:2-amino-4-hydroxy-6-hydroxymethyldihydropteridine diphosphokinase [Deltaproteobacteria bacterium]MBZ0221215.1 2-amino-4-hydroxy-6-hydroxymethyldihydropteridine diphosphokinase [Deltaproteobacteria bacterium]
MEERIFIAIGSNLGDRERNIREATRLAEKGGGLTVVKVSPLYESEPWGPQDQPRFVNAAMEARSELPPGELLRYLKGIEAEMGRREAERWGPRLIDLDIIFYGSRVIKGERIEVPHPRAHERAFVMVPLSDIAPGFVDPLSGATVSELAERLGKEGLRRMEG